MKGEEKVIEEEGKAGRGEQGREKGEREGRKSHTRGPAFSENFKS